VAHISKHHFEILFSSLEGLKPYLEIVFLADLDRAVQLFQSVDNIRRYEAHFVSD
jgi:hypothetical protein